MQKLTKQAKEYCTAAMLSLGRTYIIRELEAIGVACYDDEDTEVLAEAAVDSVEAEDIGFDWSMSFAKNLNTKTFHLWLDVDDIWQ